jgi:hypothetical protein
MKAVQSLFLGAGQRLNSANLSFGLREALMISVLGVAIASTVAYHYAG